MKKLVVTATAMIMIGTSLVSTTATGKEHYGSPTITESLAKTATRKGPALVKSPRIAKPKLFRSNPHRVSHFALIDDQDDIFIADDDLATGYRRRDLGKIEQRDDAPLSEHVRWRLFLARQLALLKYKQLHG